MEHVVIIGNGISGVTLARHIRKNSDKKITIVSSESDYFFSRTALMYVFMGHMKFEHTQPYENWFWKKNNINLKNGLVEKIDTNNRQIIFSDTSNLTYDKLVIATGSKPNKFGCKGENLQGVLGLYHKQDLENLEILSQNCKHAVIIGGGLIGIELAEMLLSKNIQVTFLVREKSFWSSVLPKEESELINRHILEHHINLKLETSLQEIISDDFGNVKSIITNKGEEILCTIVGITTGVTPNIDFLKNSLITTNKGILVNRFLETNIENVFAIGDCAEQNEAIDLRRSVEAVWYTGRMMGETLAQTICGNPMQYNPGHWFNSAKFLDIEYQTYGWVFARPLDYEQQFYWENSCGKKAIRISFHKVTEQFLGINTFGIRLRHEFFDKMLTEKKSVQFVLKNLKKANFDPEFFKSYEKQINNAFQNQFSHLKL